MTPAVSFQHHTSSTVAMRKEAFELRKTLKPLLEKQRRARINDCLNRLKSLILPLMGKDNCRYSKLEKADILEMTVRFLTEKPKTQTKDVTESYSEGYEACMQRVSALLSRTSLDQKTSARVHEFIQQSGHSVPVCRNCSSFRASSVQHRSSTLQTILRQKIVDASRKEKSMHFVGEARVAPQAALQTVWRPW